MAKRVDLTRYLSGLSVRRLGEERPAGLWITSLPVPRGAPAAFGMGGRPTHVKPLGQWPGGAAGSPRRLLLISDAGGGAPETVKLTRRAGRPASPPPTAEAELFAHGDTLEGDYYWERHLLRIAWRGRSVGLAMGMRVRGEVHWWEYCHLVTITESPTCREVEMGGTIPYDVTDVRTHKSFEGKDNPYLHKHNWLNGHIYARLHANGVCEIHAHHINSYFADLGADFADAVPVIGIRIDGGEKALRPLCGAWDGSLDGLEIGKVSFDLTDAAHLATREQPGRLDLADGFLAWQPYLGVQMYGGSYCKIRTGDDYILRAEKQVIPRGMARTIRFSLSLSDDRPPRVARYLAPAWWYGLCEEFAPEPLLPVSNEEYDVPVHNARRWFHKYMVNGGFQDGEVPGNHDGDPKDRRPPGAEGDVAGALLQISYRTGDPLDYDCAMRAGYNFVDTFVDHASKHVRMQDFTPPAIALPLQRIHSCLGAWMETGDLFCLNAARAVIENAYWWHKNSWPRMAVGRDACYIHGAMLLYRYLADGHYLEIARDSIRDLMVSQWPDGTFGDQGGGAGMHGHAAFIVKPWMGWMATSGVLDYLELFPDDEEASGMVKRFCDWLLTSFGPRNHGKAEGWTYQYPFRARPLLGRPLPEYPGPQTHLFHFDYAARLLSWCTMRTGDRSYFEAFAKSFASRGPERRASYGEGAAAFYYLPWLQMKLWNAQPADKGGISVRPVWLGERTPRSGRISTPDGEVALSWTDDGKLIVPPRAKVKVRRSHRGLCAPPSSATKLETRNPKPE